MMGGSLHHLSDRSYSHFFVILSQVVSNFSSAIILIIVAGLFSQCLPNLYLKFAAWQRRGFLIISFSLIVIFIKSWSEKNTITVFCIWNPTVLITNWFIPMKDWVQRDDNICVVSHNVGDNHDYLLVMMSKIWLNIMRSKSQSGWLITITPSRIEH